MKHLFPLLIAIVASAVTLAAQKSVFEVASVRENTSTEQQSWSYLPNFKVVNLDLRTIIQLAWGFEMRPPDWHFDFSKAPAKVIWSRFDIMTKEPLTLIKLQALLEDRFRMQTRVETRQMPIYALTVARQGELGPKLRPSRINCTEFLQSRVSNPVTDFSEMPAGCRRDIGEKPRVGGGERWSGTIQELITRVTQRYVDRPVVDMTGLKGNFEWDIDFERVGKEYAMDMLKSTFDRQLGLKLIERNGPIELVVIESIQMPSPN